MNNKNSKSFFEKNLERAKLRTKSRSSESYYVSKYIPVLIGHLCDLKSKYPGITEEEIQKKLFDEIDEHSMVVYESSYNFAKYMDYCCCRFLQSNPDKYKQISEHIIGPDIDFDNFAFSDCNNFDDYLSFYVYNLKKDLYGIICEGYCSGEQDDYKNLDNMLSENPKDLCKFFFETHFGLPQLADILCSSELDTKSKVAKVKEFSTWYKSPMDRKKFLLYANVFLNGSYSYLSTDEHLLEKMLRDDLANSISQLIDHLDALKKLDNYLISYASQMISLGLPELCISFCDANKTNANLLYELKDLPSAQQNAALAQVVSTEKLKQSLSFNFLLSSKSLSLETLLALNSFWVNRYIKEFSEYSEAMFAIHDLNIISSILNGESVDYNLDDISNVLLKMDTFYKPALIFIEKKQYEVSHFNELQSSECQHSDNEHVIRYSYDPFIEHVEKRFSSEYSEYFSKSFPKSKNNLREDLDWYIRLINPVISAYSTKNCDINALMASIEYSDVTGFLNFGVILDKVSEDGTWADLPPSIAIGIDAGLTSPIRLHTRKDILSDFKKSINSTTIVPVYSGSDDFVNPDTGKILSSQVVAPFTEKQKTILKKINKNLNKYENPRLVSHLSFIDYKFTPEHLRTVYYDERGRERKSFVTKYVDLDTGVIYTKSNGQFVPVQPINLHGEGDIDNVSR